jgi:hypothetical protein
MSSSYVVAGSLPSHNWFSAVDSQLTGLTDCQLAARPRHHSDSLQVKVKVVLRPTVSQPVCFGVNPHLGPQDQIFVNIRQFRVCHLSRSQSAVHVNFAS